MKTSNLNILYEDSHILVCEKPHGIATQNQKIGQADMVSLIKNHLAKSQAAKREPYLAVIHRLDQPVSGILVFAKTPFAAKDLNLQLTSHGFGKHYRALVDGTPEKAENTLENYLVKDKRTNLSRVCDKNTPDAKLARLYYKIIPAQTGLYKDIISEGQTELDIQLDTGRHHQIRVQMSHMGCPIVGDTKYNTKSAAEKNWQKICLCAYKLNFRHPKTKKEMEFSIT